jgi:hypothetical protein
VHLIDCIFVQVIQLFFSIIIELFPLPTAFSLTYAFAVSIRLYPFFYLLGNFISLGVRYKSIIYYKKT